VWLCHCRATGTEWSCRCVCTFFNLLWLSCNIISHWLPYKDGRLMTVPSKAHSSDEKSIVTLSEHSYLKIILRL
jgi:hypothetical protein